MRLLILNGDANLYFAVSYLTISFQPVIIPHKTSAILYDVAVFTFSGTCKSFEVCATCHLFYDVLF